MAEPYILRAWNRRWLADWFPEPEPLPATCRYCERSEQECVCEEEESW